MYHGWLIINKPVGISSAHVVAKVKRLVGRKNKVGHAGTLDPLAEGVLPIAIGEATKVTQFLLDATKEYEFDVTWGEERDTDDAEGQVVRRAEIGEQRLEITEEVLDKFRGEIEQMPPQFSALKIDGQRAYDIARAGEVADLKARKVNILKLQATSHKLQATTFQMECSKGTYVRSIARDLGRELGCFGYVSRLKRLRHGQFDLENSITLEKFEEYCINDQVSEALLPLEKVLDGIPALSLDSLMAAKIRNGIALDISVQSELVALKENEKLVAIASPKNGKLQPVRVFNH